jgi:hypothetical protein
MPGPRKALMTNGHTLALDMVAIMWLMRRLKMNESLSPVERMSENSGVSEERSTKSTGTSLSGWLATLLGFYLIGSGVFNIAKIAQGGGNATEQSAEMLRQSGIEANAAPIAIVVSYVVGAPIFLGSALLAIGSIARSVKRNGI